MSFSRCIAQNCVTLDSLKKASLRVFQKLEEKFLKSNMNVDKTTEFIANIQTMSSLWKKDDKDFFNKDKKRKAFQHLAEITGISNDECRKKLKNLKDRMRDVCSKLPKTKSGQPDFENGETTVCWTFYKQLLFMKDEFIGRPMTGSVEMDVESPSILSDDSVDETADARRLSTPVSAQMTFPSEGISKRGKRKALSKLNRQRLEKQFLAIEREKVRATLQAKSQSDEWDKFSSSICCDLRKLKDPFLILRVKASINELVNDSVLEQLAMDRDQYHPQTASREYKNVDTTCNTQPPRCISEEYLPQ